MNLPVQPPVSPMLAKRAETLPLSGEWIFEPKWDGFRTIVFWDGEELLLQSRDCKSLNRYFPELVDALKVQLPAGSVLDGEIVISREGVLDFDALSQRIHPAASRVQQLARATPASVVFFDLLALTGRDMRSTPFRDRRSALATLLAPMSAPIHLTPASDDAQVAQDWFTRFEGAGFDGVIAKGAASVYAPEKRTMLKIKHERDCDCVVAGFRWHKDGKGELVGSLLLGLYDETGKLQHVGTCASFPQAKRRELVGLLAPYRANAVQDHPWASWGAPNAEAPTRMPGAESRWSAGKDLSWEPLRPELVVEVAYEHMQGDRFRHMAQFRRWRTDKAAKSCTYAQLVYASPFRLDLSEKPATDF